MTGVELAEKLKRTPSFVQDAVSQAGITPAEMVAAMAKNAFLMNLLGHLEVETDSSGAKDFYGEGAGALLARLLVILRGYPKAVPDRLIKKAHVDMVLPSTRSIISTCIYGDNVACSSLGVPKKYGAA